MKNESGLVVFVIVAAAAISSGVGLVVFETYGWAREELRPKREVVVELTEEQVRGLPVISECEVNQ